MQRESDYGINRDLESCLFKQWAEKNLIDGTKLRNGLKTLSVPEVMKENTIPVLLVHGTADSNVPVEMTIQAAKNCIAPKKLLLVEGAEHGTGYLVDNAGYVQALQEFCCVSSAERH